MTEAEWLACADPTPMLEFLRGKASDRKLRLFASACCRLIPGYLESAPDRQGLELTERDADGLAREEDFTALPDDVWDIRWYRRDSWNAIDRAMESYWCFVWDSENLHASTEEAQTQARLRSDANLARLLFDLIGNPFRPSPPVPPSVLAWNDRTILRIAEAIYEDRKLPEGTLDPTRLAILADALLDAGCEDEDLIQHCRSEGLHLRGCWAVDLILGKT